MIQDNVTKHYNVIVKCFMCGPGLMLPKISNITPNTLYIFSINIYIKKGLTIRRKLEQNYMEKK